MKTEKYHIYLSTKERNEIVASLICLRTSDTEIYTDFACCHKVVLFNSYFFCLNFIHLPLFPQICVIYISLRYGVSPSSDYFQAFS